MSAIASNLQAIRKRLSDAARASGRPDEAVRLIAVSKTFPVGAVLEAMAAGQRCFGENYVQEALDKMSAVVQLLADREIPPIAPEWHMIGPIQSNKTRQIAEHFDWVHSVDRVKIAERLSAQRPAHLPALSVCLQVNISGEASKSGVAPQQLGELAHAVNQLPRLRLRGLMTVPEPATDFAAQCVPFAALRELAARLRGAGLPCDELSMGMSADLDAAVAEGATLVRVGSAIFGSRNYG